MSVEVGTELDQQIHRSVMFGLQVSPDWIPDHSGGWVDMPVTREQAMQVPAVSRARDIVCGTLGRLPIDRFNAGRERQRWPLMEQLEDDAAPSVSRTWLYDDGFFYARSWWVVTARDGAGWPTRLRRLDPLTVNVQQAQVIHHAPGGGIYGFSMDWPNTPDLIRFDFPHDPLLEKGARAIRTLLRLEKAAAMYSESPPAHDIFMPENGIDPFEDEAAAEAALSRFRRQRAKGSAAYIPAALKHVKQDPMTPEQLQMADSRQKAILEIARLTGVDAERLHVSTTSRTYRNDMTERQNLVDLTLAPYAEAVEGRLSEPDITPRGHYVRTNYNGFLKLAPLERMKMYEIGRRVGAWNDERIADAEDIPSAKPQAPPTPPAPAANPQASTASDDGEENAND